MQVKDILVNVNFTLMSSAKYSNRPIRGMYVSDLLSHALAKAKEGNILITVQNNVNTLAVASLLDLGCVILPDNLKANDDFINRADLEGIPVLVSKLNAVDIILTLKELGL